MLASSASPGAPNGVTRRVPPKLYVRS
jgi:hypothetical protein